jgi:hypothetical protein
MAFSLSQFAASRPHLFHLTSRRNIESLKETLELAPALHLFGEARTTQWMSTKRPEHVEIKIGKRKIDVRDQRPLHKGNMALLDGWTFEQFIEHINSRVFFWPGGIGGSPIDYGRRHFARYAAESPALLRTSTADVFSGNKYLSPEFCRYNSGSPRWTRGRASPRGRNTFVTCEDAHFRAAEVVEVTFPGVVRLPQSCQIAYSPDGPWRSSASVVTERGNRSSVLTALYRKTCANHFAQSQFEPAKIPFFDFTEFWKIRKPDPTKISILLSHARRPVHSPCRHGCLLCLCRAARSSRSSRAAGARRV